MKRPTVLFAKEGKYYKICKVFFTKDGTYNVTSPYHPEKDAGLFYKEVNLSLHKEDFSFSSTVISLLKDDADRVKLAHHPDGFVHFSGQGIVSGRDENGNAKGVGLVSWPLDNPVQGPSFAISMRDVAEFDIVEKTSPGDIVFSEEEFSGMSGPSCICLEGFYFTETFKRFFQKSQDGNFIMQIVHPIGSIISLKMLVSPNGTSIPGIIGLYMYYALLEDINEPFIFSLSGPTGNIRKNENGEVIGRGTLCVCPAHYFPVGRSANYMKPETIEVDQTSGATKIEPAPSSDQSAS